MRSIIVVLSLMMLSCHQTSNRSVQKITTLDSNAATNVVLNEGEGIVLQTFSKVPISISGCSGLFVPDTASQTSINYLIATDLKGTAFLKLNNRLLELKLIRQTNIDSTTIYELYTSDEVEVDLKMKQSNKAEDAVWNYNGVMILRREGKNYAVPVRGKVGC